MTKIWHLAILNVHKVPSSVLELLFDLVIVNYMIYLKELLKIKLNQNIQNYIKIKTST